jgi:tRNA uridine 5-carboxymethylaminomethyl modification enzyme
MREVLESQPNLKIKQAEVAELVVEEQPSAVSRQLSASADTRFLPARICRGIVLRDGRRVGAKAVVITTGTF